MLDRQLAGGNHPLGLVADVQQDFVTIDLDNRAGHDVAVVEILDRLVDRREKGLFAADVVDSDLGGTRLLGSADGHEGGTPMRTDVVVDDGQHAPKAVQTGPEAVGVFSASKPPSRPDGSRTN
jgi:hypothetical protein